MKNYYLVFVSAVLVFFASNTLAGPDSFENQSVCQIKQNLHQNMANILTNDIGIDVLVKFMGILSEICMDPKAHNAIIFLLDTVTDNLTSPVVAESLGHIFYWIRKLIKNQDFQLTLHETMNGVNKLLDRIDVLNPMLTTIFKNIQNLFDDPNFDSTFDLVVENVNPLVNMKRHSMYKIANSLLVKPLSLLGVKSETIQPQSRLTKSTSTKK